MAGGFLAAFQYLDEVMELVSALAAYPQHRDESFLAEQIAEVVFSAVNDATHGLASETVDKEALVIAVGGVVEVLETAGVFGDDE